MRKPKVRELGEAIRSLFSKPFTTKFPFEPPTTIQPEFRGKPVYVDEKCVRCGACAVVCPARAIDIIEESNKRILVRDYGKCIYCGQCGALCTTKEGIKFTNEFALATLDRTSLFETIEDELVKCERCGKTITTKKHLYWLYEKLGTKAYANPTVFLSRFKLEDVIESLPKIDREKITREDFYRILCPDCRRAVYMQDEWGNI